MHFATALVSALQVLKSGVPALRLIYMLGNTKLKTILRMLLHTYPKIVNINFSPHLLQGADAWDDLRLDILSTIRAQPTEQDREKGVGFLDTRTKVCNCSQNIKLICYYSAKLFGNQN